METNINRRHLLGGSGTLIALPQEYFDKYPLETLQLPEAREDDLNDLPERFKLLAGFEAKFGKGYHDMLVEKGYDKHGWHIF